MPREVDLVMRGTLNGEGEHTELLRTIRGKLNPHTGDLELTGAEFLRVQVAARNWRLGHERAFKAIMEAAVRHV